MTTDHRQLLADLKQLKFLVGRLEMLAERQRLLTAQCHDILGRIEQR